MTNISLRKNASTVTDSYYLVVKGDWNDADYIEKSTIVTEKELNKVLPYISIMWGLFDSATGFNGNQYNVRISDSPKLAFNEWLKRDSIYEDLLGEKKVNGWDIFSTNMQNISEDDFKDFYEKVVKDVRDFLAKEPFSYLPSCSDNLIHTITDIYVEKNGEKYDIEGDWFSAFGELMENKAIEKYNWPVEK